MTLVFLIPKSITYFLEKSVIFGSIKKSSFTNLLWNPITSFCAIQFMTIDVSLIRNQDIPLKQWRY